MVITKLQLENKLEEYKKIDNLYDVAISVHKKTISDAKKGALRFTQISDPKLFGLLYGDLKRLSHDRANIQQEIAELQTQLRAQPSPAPQELEPEAASSLVEEVNIQESEGLGSNKGETEKVTEREVSTATDFNEVTFTPDLTTPDIFLDREVSDTLGQLGCNIDEL